ncbi:MAG: hypothetical protein K5856_02910 [Bacteroidaceae bacterium]|nr:hypothetical protein [Bacteroidaceae bacterium]
MKQIHYILFGVLVLCITACSKEDSSWLDNHLASVDEYDRMSRKPIKPTIKEIPVTRPLFYEKDDPETDRMIGNELRGYSWRLFKNYYRKLRNRHIKDENMVYAPHNMLITLSRKMEGMDQCSQDQLLKEMGLEAIPLDFFTDFIDKTETFKNLDENVWVSDASNTPSIRGHWWNLFPVIYTKKEMFETADGTQKEVDMMFRSIFCENSCFEKYHIAKLDVGHYIQVFFVLPNYNATIDDVFEEFDLADLKRNASSMLNFWMPKFSVSKNVSFDLMATDVEVNIHQDIDLAFSESGVADNADKLWKINTATYETPYMGNSNFRLDQPFIYGIYEKITGMPLYLGYYGY